MKIYLDYNLFVFLCDGVNPELEAKVKSLSDRHIFPYSPAHLEEVATALMQPKFLKLDDPKRFFSRKLDSISEISGNRELYPSDDGPITMKAEYPIKCLGRVLRYYDSNPGIEANEARMLEIYKAADTDGGVANRMSNLPVDFLLNTEHGEKLHQRLHSDLDFLVRCRTHCVDDLTWPSISKHFPVLERALELSLNFLENVRYRPEQVVKSRSRMHDVTHCIYASNCEQFVTQDKRLYDKVRAVYLYFGIPTRVLTLQEFLDMDYE